LITEISPLLNILLLSIMASLGTGVGGLIAALIRPSRRSYGFLMGLTAGVMICLSFLELVPEALEQSGWVTATIGFALGAVFMFALDHLIPHIRFGEKEVRDTVNIEVNGTITGADGLPVEVTCCDAKHMGKDCKCQSEPKRRGGLFSLRRADKGEPVDRKLINTGVLMAIGIAIHNLPEGIAVGAGYLHNPQFGIFVAIAILLHNIPEGIATALPLCRGGICRRDAIKVAFLSGLAEPIGAVLASLVLINFTALLPGALAFAAGVMVFITLDELIPTAREHGHNHFTAIGIIVGSLFVFVLSGILGI